MLVRARHTQVSNIWSYFVQPDKPNVLKKNFKICAICVELNSGYPVEKPNSFFVLENDMRVT